MRRPRPSTASSRIHELRVRPDALQPSGGVDGPASRNGDVSFDRHSRRFGRGRTFHLPPCTSTFHLPPSTFCDRPSPPSTFHYPPSSTFHLPPSTFRLPPSAFHLRGSRVPMPDGHQVRCLPPSTFHLPPCTFHLARFHLPPSTFRLPPSTFHLPPSRARPALTRDGHPTSLRLHFRVSCVVPRTRKFILVCRCQCQKCVDFSITSTMSRAKVHGRKTLVASTVCARRT